MEINSRFLDALGFTLVDSLWQGLIILAVAFLGLAVMKKAPARWRHNFLLVCMLALPIGGVYSFNQHQKLSAEVVDNVMTTKATGPNLVGGGIVNEEFSTVSQLQMETFWLVDKAHWIGLLWVIGLAIVSLRGVGGILYLKRLKLNATEVQQPEIIRLLADLRSDFGLKTAVLIKESSKVMSPLVSGYFKPIILFPLGLIQGLTTEEVEVILLHELAHLKRNDFLINIVINGLRAVYFYHPAYWWLQSQLDNEREYATDEMVMSKQSNGLLLVKALAKTQEYKMTTPSLGFAGNSKNQLLKRVNRIMKKQQNPNWFSGVFTILVLGAAFVLMSQSQTKREVIDTGNVAKQLDTEKAVRPSLKLPTQEEVENANLKYVDSLGNRHVYLINAQKDTVHMVVFPSPDGPSKLGLKEEVGSFDLKQDTTGVGQAIQEIIQAPSPIMVEYNGNGNVISIKRNGKLLKGDEFNTYEKAFTKLNRYASKTFKNNIDRLNKQADVVYLIEDSKSTFEKLSLELKQLNDKSEYASQMAKERIEELNQRKRELKAYVDELKNGPNKAEGNKYLAEVARLEAYIYEFQQEELLNIDHNKAVVLELRAYESKVKNKNENAGVYVDRLKQLIEKARGQLSTENKLQMELQLKYIELEMKDILSSQDRKLQEEFREKAEKIIEDQEASTNLRAHESVLEEYNALQQSGKGPILEINGVLKPNTKFSDLNQDDIVSISIIKGKSQENRYPNGETKGYNGLVVIKTFEGMTGLRLKGNGTVSTTTFSKDKSNYTFSEDNTGQSQAMSTLEAAQALEEDYVVVFNGKFMPKDYLFKYTDSYIEEINIYKGDALKKFPKRKVKDHDTVIEVITKKMPRRKN